MRTKLVYVVVDPDENYYTEQTLVSAWSARYYNPQCNIIILCDKTAFNNFSKYEQKFLDEIINDIIIVDTPQKLTSKGKSRWIKTKIRDLIQGDFLYLDTDTVVCSSLSEIDGWDIDMGAVSDYHCQFRKAPYRDDIIQSVRTVYGYNLKKNSHYFNSGVIYAKDSEKANEVYRIWHSYWLQGLKKGKERDQLALACATSDSPISEIDGAYNCMIRTSIQYLSTAKIIHFYNTGVGGERICPFLGKRFYKTIRDNLCISEEMKSMILSCKSQFTSPSVVMDAEDSAVILSEAFKLLRMMFFKHKKVYTIINYLSIGIMKVIGKSNC